MVKVDYKLAMEKATQYYSQIQFQSAFKRMSPEEQMNIVQKFQEENPIEIVENVTPATETE